MADLDPNETALGRGRTARWVLITGAAQMVRVAITIASAAILGRLLTPSDFGLVATVAPLIALTSMLQNLGLNQALIQRPNLERAHVNALFYLTLAASLVLLAVLFLLAPLIASIFTEPRLTAIVQAMAVLAVIAAAASTPMGLMNRRLHFARLAAIDIAAPLIGLAVGAAVAFATRSYWSLVVMQGVTVTAQLIGALLLGQWSPGRARFDADLRAMIGLGAGFSTFNLLNFLSRNADNVLIAYAHGPAALGLYERSYRLMLNPLMQAMTPFGRVLMPVLARLQNYPTLYRQHFAESTALLMSAVQPAVVTALVFPVSTVTTVLGDHWGAAAPLFFWLAPTPLNQK
jgi:polysaccharide transporter, PST family